MSKKTLQIIFGSLIVLMMVGCVGVYVYDIVANGSPFYDNLLILIFALSMLTVALIRNFKVKSRGSLLFYEKAYEKELGNAFSDNSAYRKFLIMATRYYDESKYSKALKLLGKLSKEAKRETDLAPVLLFAALCYTDMGLVDHGIKTYYELIEIYPRNSQAHSNLGGLHLQNGDFKLALSHYTEAIKCDKNNYYAFNNRANCYFRMQDYDSAIADAKCALEIKNNGVEAATLLAIIYAMKGDAENKEKYYHLATVSGRPAQEIDLAISHHIAEMKELEELEKEVAEKEE